jgi:hypothetical protein
MFRRSTSGGPCWGPWPWPGAAGRVGSGPGGASSAFTPRASSPVVAKSTAEASRAGSPVNGCSRRMLRSTLNTANQVFGGNSREIRSSAPLRASGAVATGSTSKTSTTRLARDGASAAAAGAAGAAAGAVGGEAARRLGAASGRTSRNDAISQSCPSSKTWSSCWRRSSTRRPFLSRATTSSRTTWVSDRNVGGCSCAGTGTPAHRAAAQAKARSRRASRRLTGHPSALP